MKVIEHVRDFLEADISALGSASGVIKLTKDGLIANHLLLFIDYDALSGSGGESLIITPKLVFGDDLTATVQKKACGVFDHNGGVAGTAITITGTGAAGCEWWYIISGAYTSKEHGSAQIMAPGVLLEFTNTNYTGGAMRFGYLAAG